MSESPTLIQDDVRMAEFSEELTDQVKLSEQESKRLASTLYREMHALASRGSFNVVDVVPYKERFNELALYMNWHAETRSAEETQLAEHAKLVLSNYICFVYLGETCFTRLRKELPTDTAASVVRHADCRL